MKHEEKNKLLEKNRILLRYAYGFVLLAITAVYFLDDRANQPVKRISNNNSLPTSVPLQKMKLLLRRLLMRLTYESQEYGDLLKK